MTEKNIAVEIGGKRYEYVSGVIKEGEENCVGCALLQRCTVGHVTSLCGIFGIADDSTGVFQQVAPADHPAPESDTCQIDADTYRHLLRLGIIGAAVRSHNVGKSDYSRRLIQPWSIWIEYELNPWDADIVKRVLRTKEGEPRQLDYEKIIHICQERMRQLGEF